MEKLLKPREVAEMVGIPYDTACHLMRTGQIASIPVGKRADGPKARLATTESRVERWLRERESSAVIAASKKLPAKALEKKRRAEPPAPGDPPEGMEIGPDGRLRIKRRR